LRKFKFKQIDVFTTIPFEGNPAAVVFGAENLTTKEMQTIAKEMNLSETTFVLPPKIPKADYRVRFFTPRDELPFAGHPTIATALAVIEEGLLFKNQIPTLIIQECAIGTISVLVEKQNNGLFFMMNQASPQWLTTEISQQNSALMLGCELEAIMNLPAEVVSTGVPWLIIPVNSLQVIKTLKPDMFLIEKICKGIGAYGITTFCMDAEYQGHQVHARSFAPGAGVSEDPVCGTGNGSIAAYIAKYNLLHKQLFNYLSEQGAEVGRPGLIMVKVQPENGEIPGIQIGGQAVKVIEGELFI
jgi:PhzF family phenazine biosynthesis protein